MKIRSHSPSVFLLLTFQFALSISGNANAEAACSDPGLKLLQTQLSTGVYTIDKLTPILKKIESESQRSPENYFWLMSKLEESLKLGAKSVGYTVSTGAGGLMMLVGASFVAEGLVSAPFGGIVSVLAGLSATYHGPGVAVAGYKLTNRVADNINLESAKVPRTAFAEKPKVLFVNIFRDDKSGKLSLHKNTDHHIYSEDIPTTYLTYADLRKYLEERSKQFSMARKEFRERLEAAKKEVSLNQRLVSKLSIKKTVLEMYFESYAAKGEAALMEAEREELQNNIKVVDALCAFLNDPNKNILGFESNVIPKQVDQQRRTPTPASGL
ncbi:MAG: hypothetical protein K2X47_11530 [Bdellovibrionales bacterium]|nr:hypothetical protein [Bdellovibrionales bacterium]